MPVSSFKNSCQCFPHYLFFSSSHGAQGGGRKQPRPSTHGNPSFGAWPCWSEGPPRNWSSSVSDLQLGPSLLGWRPSLLGSRATRWTVCTCLDNVDSSETRTGGKKKGGRFHPSERARMASQCALVLVTSGKALRVKRFGSCHVKSIEDCHLSRVAKIELQRTPSSQGIKTWSLGSCSPGRSTNQGILVFTHPHPVLCASNRRVCFRRSSIVGAQRLRSTGCLWVTKSIEKRTKDGIFVGD